MTREWAAILHLALEKCGRQHVLSGAVVAVVLWEGEREAGLGTVTEATTVLTSVSGRDQIPYALCWGGQAQNMGHLHFSQKFLY
jgi:hypothetical protein